MNATRIVIDKDVKSTIRMHVTMVEERHAQQMRILDSKPSGAHGKVRHAGSSFLARQAPLIFYKRHGLADAHQALTARRSICGSERTRCVHTEIGLIDVITFGEIVSLSSLSVVVSGARSCGPIRRR